MLVLELLSSRPVDLERIPSDSFSGMSSPHLKTATDGYRFDVDGVEYYTYFLKHTKGEGVYFFEYGIYSNNHSKKMQHELVSGNDGALPFKVFARVSEAILRFIETHKPQAIMILGYSDRQSEFYARALPKLAKILPPEYRVEKIANNITGIMRKDYSDEG